MIDGLVSDGSYPSIACIASACAGWPRTEPPFLSSACARKKSHGLDVNPIYTACGWLIIHAIQTAELPVALSSREAALPKFPAARTQSGQAISIPTPERPAIPHRQCEVINSRGQRFTCEHTHPGTNPMPLRSFSAAAQILQVLAREAPRQLETSSTTTCSHRSCGKPTDHEPCALGMSAGRRVPNWIVHPNPDRTLRHR